MAIEVKFEANFLQGGLVCLIALDNLVRYNQRSPEYGRRKSGTGSVAYRTRI
jgi:hypothetical protein